MSNKYGNEQKGMDKDEREYGSQPRQTDPAHRAKRHRQRPRNRSRRKQTRRG